MTAEKPIFISYSSKDGEYVSKIINELERIGAPYWKAPEMIPAGSSYAKEIPPAIRSCSLFLLVLSPDSQNSIWVEKEIDSAICSRKMIIPLQIRTVRLNDTFQFYLNNVQMVSCVDSEKRAFDELRRQIYQVMPSLKDKKPAAPVKNTNVAENAVKNNVTGYTNGVAASQKSKPQISVNAVAPNANDMSDEADPRNRVLSIEPGAGSIRKMRNSHTNALRVNRIPLACQYCGCKELENVTMGTYRCVRCGKDNYDDFQTIRNYLDKAGATSALVIERATGVPRRIIEYFFRDEYLEIPKSSNVRIPCASCGAPIRTGTLCERCKSNPEKVANAKDRRGKWHLL